MIFRSIKHKITENYFTMEEMSKKSNRGEYDNILFYLYKYNIKYKDI